MLIWMGVRNPRTPLSIPGISISRCDLDFEKYCRRLVQAVVVSRRKGTDRP